MSREYFEGEFESSRTYSRAIKVKGGTTVYLAGVGAPFDDKGNSLAGNFAAQAHGCFAALQRVMADVGGSMDDITTMTVYITDSRYGTEFVEVRREYFSKGYPCSALIGIESLAKAEMMVEIQATAVLQD